VGILLYAITTGRLPFQDDVAQRVFQRITFAEPDYPVWLSAQLIDLLKKILVKVPGDRITISEIKRHPWLAQSEYAQLLVSPFSKDDSFSVRRVQRGFVDHIERLGVDIRLLPHQILDGEYNETTAIYAILCRAMIADRVRELMQRLTTTPKIRISKSGAPISARVTGVPKQPVRTNMSLPQAQRYSAGRVSSRVAMPLIRPIIGLPAHSRASSGEEKGPLTNAETPRGSPRQVTKSGLMYRHPCSHGLK
jgi:serine/threonine protein kinase